MPFKKMVIDEQKKVGLSILFSFFSIFLAMTAWLFIGNHGKPIDDPGKPEFATINVVPVENGKCGTHDDAVLAIKKFSADNLNRVVGPWSFEIKSDCFVSVRIKHQEKTTGASLGNRLANDQNQAK